jgi:hypothetical protein
VVEVLADGGITYDKFACKKKEILGASVEIACVE